MRSWIHRRVNNLPKLAFFRFVAGHILVPFWAFWTPVKRQPGGPPHAVQPGENLQRMMNLVMPLRDKTALGRAMVAQVIADHLDEIFAGLDNVGNVHFARFIIIENNLCMISAYDGDFSNYIRDFIAQIGSVFDGIVELIEGGESVLPTETNIEAFIAWVRDRDLYQLPEPITSLLYHGDPVDTAKTSQAEDDLRLLPRALILQLHSNRNVSLGGYRSYPGVSVAQIRQASEMSW